MAKYTRFDPRNKKNGRSKFKTIGGDFKNKIRMTEEHKDVHRYKGTKINWILPDDVEEDNSVS